MINEKQKKINIRFVGLYVGLMLFLGMAAGCGLIHDEEKLLASAAQNQKKGEHSAAIIEFKKVLQKNPDSKVARLGVAKSYLATQQGDSAEKELRRAISLGVKKDDVIIELANALLMQNKIDEIFSEIPVSDNLPAEKKAKIYLTYGYAYFAQQKMDQSRASFEKAMLDKSASISAYIGLSKLASAKNDFEAGLVNISKALKLNNSSGEAWFQRGHINMAMGNMQEARRSYKNVVKVSPKDMMSNQEFQARFKLSQIALTEKNIAAANEQVAVMAKHAPNNHMTRYMSAMISFQNKDYSKARSQLEQLAANMPDFLQAQLLMGAIYFAQGHLEQANEVLSRFVTKVPTHIQARKLLASVKMKSGRHEDALDTLKQVGESTNDTELLAMIGRASVLSNEADKGLAYLKRASKTDPKNQLLREELAKVYLKTGSIDDAIKELNAISGNSKQELNKQRLLVQAHLRKQDFVKARKQAQQIIAGNKQAPENFALAGFIEMVAGDRAAARKFYNKALSIDKNHVPSLLSLGRMEMEDGNLVPAEERFKQILSTDQKNIHAMMGMANLAGRKKKPDEGIKWLNDAIAANPTSIEPRLVLSRYYMSTRNPAKAITLLEEADKQDGSNKTVLMMLTRARVAGGHKEAALLTANKMVKKWPKDPGTYLALARIQELMKYHQKAMRTLDKAISIKKDFIQARIMKASLHIKHKEYKAADKTIAYLQKNYADKPIGFALEGEKWLAKKDYAKAATAFSKANNKQSAAEFVRKMSASYYRAGDQTKSVSVLKTWLKKKPDDSAVRFDLANLYEKVGKSAKAIAEYEKLLQKSAKNIAVLNNMAFIYLPKDKAKALDYAKRAYDLKPDIPAIADTYGWVLLQTGKLDLALPILEKAAAKSAHPSIQYHYAVALDKKGEKLKAKAVLDKLVKPSMKFPEKEKAKALLKAVSQ